MIEYYDNKINSEILKYNDKENAFEIIIRGEAANNNCGLIVCSDNNNQLNYKKVIQEISELKLNEVEQYLIKNKIKYNKIQFI